MVDCTKINQTEVSIPDKEMHGLWLAASNDLKSLTNYPGNQDNHKNSLCGFGYALTSCGPVQTSTDIKAQIKRLYINIHLFEISKSDRSEERGHSTLN